MRELNNVPYEPPENRSGSLRRFLKEVWQTVVLSLVVFAMINYATVRIRVQSISMQPTLYEHDFVLVNKLAYQIGQLQRKDVVVFRPPIEAEKEPYIKRVIGLPGDTVQMIGGTLHLNGQPVPKQRIEDLEVAVSPNTRCYSPQFAAKRADGTDVCRYPRYRETLPGGRSYEVLDLGPREKDDTPAVVVPAGHLFLMGDNRDNSEDSRFPAEPGRGIGLVPMDNLVGEAKVMMWSTDGSAEWLLPWTWFTAARWDRIGGTF